MPAISEALDIISTGDLSPTEHLLLKHFVEGAVDSQLAAEYLLSRLSSDDVEGSLRHLKQDWRGLAVFLSKANPIPRHLQDLLRRRDGPSCFITRDSGKRCSVRGEPAHVIPPSLIDDVENSADVSTCYNLVAYSLHP